MVTPQAQVANKRFDHSVENCNKFHAKLKVPFADEQQEKTVQDMPEGQERHRIEKELLHKSCRHTMTEGSSEEFTFLGIKWRHASHVVDLRKPEDKLSEPNLLSSVVTNYSSNSLPKWSGTRREMASVAGRLMWWRRVQDVRFSQQDHQRRSAALREMYSHLPPPEDVTKLRNSICRLYLVYVNTKRNMGDWPSRNFFSKIPPGIWTVDERHGTMNALLVAHCEAYGMWLVSGARDGS